MPRRLFFIPFLTTVLWGSLVDAPDPVCGQASNEGTIICCNQHVKVRGNWVGALHSASCEDYARTNAPARAQLCKMKCLSEEAKEQYCRESCKENPKPPGSVYAGVLGARTRAQPGETAETVGSTIPGQRLVYRDVKKVNGTMWYRVAMPPYLAGWISENEVFCELPPPPPPPPPDHSCKKNLKVPGTLYVGVKTNKIYGEPNSDSPVLGSLPSGTRLGFKEVRTRGKETWFHVTLPGRPPRWAKGSDLVCSRPGEPMPQKIVKPLDSSLATDRPTAAIASGGRG